MAHENWPQYKSHKLVRAAQIIDIERGTGGYAKVLIKVRATPDAELELFESTVPSMKDKAEIGGYAVVYDDGFCSISPQAAFEGGYRLVGDEEPTDSDPESY
jgi:hypothetical protein